MSMMRSTSLGFEPADSAKRMFETFGPDSLYDNPASAKYTPAIRYNPDKTLYPIAGKWRGILLRRFSECYAAGKTVEDLKDEDKTDSPTNIPRLVPLVAFYASKPEMLNKAEMAAIQLQTCDLSLAVVLGACRILECYIMNADAGDPQSHLKTVIEELKSHTRLNPQPMDRAVAGHLQAALGSLDLSVVEATKKFGKP